jgi:hypothetical protein
MLEIYDHLSPCSSKYLLPFAPDMCFYYLLEFAGINISTVVLKCEWGNPVMVQMKINGMI